MWLYSWKNLRVPAALMVGAMTLLAEPLPRPMFQREQPPKAPAYVAPRPVPAPDDAVRLALVDVLTFPEHDRCHLRYLFLQDGMDDGRQKRVTSVAVNYTHRAATVIRPDDLVGGYLVRVNLQYLAPRHRDYEQFKNVWEELRYDPMFSRFLTRDQLDKLEGNHPVSRVSPKSSNTVRRRLVRPAGNSVEWVDHPGGRLISPDDYKEDRGTFSPGRYQVRCYWREKVEEYDEEVVGPVQEAVATAPTTDVVRYNSCAVDPILFERLQLETHSLAPVVDHRYFSRRALTSIQKDDPKNADEGNVFQIIFGGLYYQLTGIRKAKDVFGKDTKVTDEDLFFQDRGVGNIKGGVNSEQVYNALRSDQGAIMLESAVTGKPRDVWFIETPAGDSSITGDVGDQNIDIGDRVQRNLLNQRVKAKEGIFWKDGIRGHRMPLFVLFNGDGALQDEVPFFIANDTRIPRPHTQRLQAGMSCIGCHSVEGESGMQPVTNDVPALTSAVDIFGELTRTGSRGTPLRGRHRVVKVGGRTYVLDPDSVDRITGRYKAGQQDLQVRIADNRDSLVRATLRATGNWVEDDKGKPCKPGDYPDSTKICKLAAEQLERVVNGYWYDRVTAKSALHELGLDVVEGQAVETLRAVLPPDLRNIVTDEHGRVVFIQEDPVVAALVSPRIKGVSRSDWALSRDYIAERVVKSSIYQKMRGRGK